MNNLADRARIDLDTNIGAVGLGIGDSFSGSIGLLVTGKGGGYFAAGAVVCTNTSSDLCRSVSL